MVERAAPRAPARAARLSIPSDPSDPTPVGASWQGSDRHIPHSQDGRAIDKEAHSLDACKPS